MNVITCEIIDPASPNLVFELFMGMSQMCSYLGHLDVLSRLLRSNQLVNAITCVIFNPALLNLVYGLFMVLSRMSSYLGHLDILSRSLRSNACIDLLTFTL